MTTLIQTTKNMKDIRRKFRGFRVRNSIVYPIVLLLVFIGAGILFAGYQINKSVFRTVFEERSGTRPSTPTG